MAEYNKIDPAVTPAGWRWLMTSAGAIDQGGSVEEQLRRKEEFVRREGLITSPQEWRRAMIQGAGLRPPEWGQPTGDPDENLIMTGCRPLGGIRQIMAFCRLIQRLGGRYTFLSKEYCCMPFMNTLPLVRGDSAAREAGLRSAREFIGMNIAEARRLGVKRMYYVCHSCLYQARRFYSDCDVEQRYIMDLLVDCAEKAQPRLKLEAKVAYFQGGQHKRSVYLGDSDWDCDWAAYRRLLDRVEGLSVATEISDKFCCMILPDRDRIWNATKGKQLTTLVSPCMSCVGVLGRSSPQISIKSVPEMLLEALDQ